MPEPDEALDDAEDGGETVFYAEDGIADEPGHQSWRSTWGSAVALLMVGVGLAGMIVVAHWALAKSKPAPAATRPAAPASAPAPTEGTMTPPSAWTTSEPAVAPPSISSTPDQDSKYIHDLNEQGISFSDSEAAIHNGKIVCQNISRGMTVQQVVAEFRASSPAFSHAAHDYVAISVHTYCPQHDELVQR
ncbi:DUF732 domain-containing protein [Mycobacterium sp.]|uniref:DUF732 domain-containing protein n=1 Tax=Mycobacterium sp. TaxID=1785 RepID=UPI003BA9877C